MCSLIQLLVLILRAPMSCLRTAASTVLTLCTLMPTMRAISALPKPLDILLFHHLRVRIAVVRWFSNFRQCSIHRQRSQLSASQHVGVAMLSNANGYGLIGRLQPVPHHPKPKHRLLYGILGIVLIPKIADSYSQQHWAQHAYMMFKLFYGHCSAENERFSVTHIEHEKTTKKSNVKNVKVQQKRKLPSVWQVFVFAIVFVKLFPLPTLTSDIVN